MEIENLYAPLRLMLGDHDPNARLYKDSILLDAVKTMLVLQKVKGFELTPDGQGITPEPNANQLALMIYHTVRLFVMGKPDRYSWRTRALSVSYGSAQRWLAALEEDIDQLENGDRFATYQSMYAWFQGMSGLPLDVLVQFQAEAPLWRASLGLDGLRVN